MFGFLAVCVGLATVVACWAGVWCWRSLGEVS